MAGRVVLVTGVARQLGGQVAAALAADPDVATVIGVDVVAPRDDLGVAEFVRADIRNPMIAKVIAAAAVDTVVHMNVLATPLGAGGRGAMKEINVIGTMQLLAACQKAPTLQRLVLKSTATVYGSTPGDPAMFTEATDTKSLPRAGFGRDAVEVEGYVRGFGRRRPDVDVTVLRFANFIGPRVETPLTRYFSLPVVPRVLGYDPRLQFVHEDDAVEVVRRAAAGAPAGTYNVAGDGVLLLSQAIRRAGRPMVGLPAAAVNLAGTLVRRAGLVDFSPDQLHFLEHGRGLDTTRLRTMFGYTPAYTTEAAFADFVRGRGLEPHPGKRSVRAADRLAASVIGRRGTADA